MTPLARSRRPHRYEPSPVWEKTAREFERMLADIGEETSGADLVANFAHTKDGLIGIRWGLRVEEAARIAATSTILGIASSDVVERAMATQWFLDKNVATGLEPVLHGVGRFRREIRSPFPARLPD